MFSYLIARVPFGNIFVISEEDEVFIRMSLKKFVITHKLLKKLTAHECHRSELLCSPRHSVSGLFIFHRYMWARSVKRSKIPLE